MAAHRHRILRQWTPGGLYEEIMFLVLGGIYSLAFWALQGCQMWRALQH